MGSAASTVGLVIALGACGNRPPSSDSAGEDSGPPQVWWEDGGTPVRPDARVPGGGLELQAPVRVTTGIGFPVIVRTSDRSPYDGQATLRIAGEEVAQLVLYRGRGSARVVIDDVGDYDISAAAGSLQGSAATMAESADTANTDEVSGDLGEGEHTWAAQPTVRVTGDVTVPLGATLTIEAGALVRLDAGVHLVVLGRLVVEGSATRPVLFAPAGSEPWGGIEVRGTDAQADLQYALLTGGGGVGSRARGHSSSQPVILAEGSAVRVRGGGLIDNPGKAFYGSGAVLRYEDIVVSRCDTGGEYSRSAVEILDSHYLEFPDGDGRVEDDDNDGSYFGTPLSVDGVEQPTRIIRSVFAMGEDDGIDQNGGLVVIESSWIEGFNHECIAASSGRSVTVRDSVIRGCEQGIEAGYGSPRVIVERTIVTGNAVGLRFGDSYAEAPTGTLSVSASVIAFNDVDLLESDDAIDVAGKIELSCSLVSDAGLVTGSNLLVEDGWDFRSCGEYPSPPECERPGPAVAICEGW